MPSFSFQVTYQRRGGLNSTHRVREFQVRRTQNCTFIVFITFDLGLGGEVEGEATSDHVCNMSFELRFTFFFLLNHGYVMFFLPYVISYHSTGSTRVFNTTGQATILLARLPSFWLSLISLISKSPWIPISFPALCK